MALIETGPVVPGIDLANSDVQTPKPATSAGSFSWADLGTGEGKETPPPRSANLANLHSIEDTSGVTDTLPPETVVSQTPTHILSEHETQPVMPPPKDYSAFTGAVPAGTDPSKINPASLAAVRDFTGTRPAAASAPAEGRSDESVARDSQAAHPERWTPAAANAPVPKDYSAFTGAVPAGTDPSKINPASLAAVRDFTGTRPASAPAEGRSDESVARESQAAHPERWTPATAKAPVPKVAGRSPRADGKHTSTGRHNPLKHAPVIAATHAAPPPQPAAAPPAYVDVARFGIYAGTNRFLAQKLPDGTYNLQIQRFDDNGKPHIDLRTGQAESTTMRLDHNGMVAYLRGNSQPVDGKATVSGGEKMLDLARQLGPQIHADVIGRGPRSGNAFGPGMGG